MKRIEFIGKWSIARTERERRIRDEFIDDLDSLIKERDEAIFHAFKKCNFKCGDTELDKQTCQCFNDFKELTDKL